MMYYKLYFEPYDWEIEMYIILKNCNIERIMYSLKESPSSEIQKMFVNLTTKINSGFIKSYNKKSVIVINKPSNLSEFVNIYNHEINHLEMHICEDYEIDPYSEEASILSGELAEYLFNSLINGLLK